MTTTKLDPLTVHNDDLVGPQEGRFGNIYYQWDTMKSRKRESDERQLRIALNRSEEGVNV